MMRRKFVWIAAPVLIFVTAAYLAAVAVAGGTGCSFASKSLKASCAAHSKTASLDGYTDGERKVIRYICDAIASSGRLPDFTSEEIEKATGVSIAGLDESRIEAGVVAELRARNVDIDAMACKTTCAKFGACSVDKNLMTATGDELAKYAEEKNTDARVFTDWVAPDFTLPTTAGDRVRLSEYRGRPVALIFMASHCNHCVDTVPVLAELNEKYTSKGLAIVPVLINGRSVEHVKSWAQAVGADFPIAVSEGTTISDAYGSRLVPTVFLISPEGRITKKFVGFKSGLTLDVALGEFMGGMN